MLLVVDIGNTHTVLGIYADRNSECLHHWRLASDRKKTEDEYAVLLLAMLQAKALPQIFAGGAAGDFCGYAHQFANSAG